MIQFLAGLLSGVWVLACGIGLYNHFNNEAYIWLIFGPILALYVGAMVFIAHFIVD